MCVCSTDIKIMILRRMSIQVSKLIIDPIPVDELTETDINEYHMTDDASAVIILPNGATLNVPKSGGSFDVAGSGLTVGSTFKSKLYMYDRQPNDPVYGDVHFAVQSGPITVKDGIARMKFVQGGPAITFSLINS